MSSSLTPWRWADSKMIGSSISSDSAGSSSTIARLLAASLLAQSVREVRGRSPGECLSGAVDLVRELDCYPSKLHVVDSACELLRHPPFCRRSNNSLT